MSISTSRPGAGHVRELADSTNGQVITPGDPDYDAARTTFYGGFDRKPAAIIQAADPTDVARVVTFVRERGLELGVRSGGHSLAGHCVVDGGVVLDLSRMREIEIDPDGRTAWAQSGATAREFTAAGDAHGLGVGFGDAGSVGVGGITLGGGIGFLVRKYGLTIDSLLAADVVTADGELIRVDADSHPDLFWAIRGGGGNFGVATRFHFRLHEVSPMTGGMMMLPATPETIAGFMAEAEAAPESLSAIANVMVAPPAPIIPEELHGKLILMAMMAHVGPAEDGERAVAPFRALAKPYADMVRPIRYPEIYPPDEEGYHPVATGRNLFLDAVDEGLAATILERLQSTDAMMRVTQLRMLGGAMARIDADATAFAHRNRRIMANVAAVYERPEQADAYAPWVTDFAEALHRGDRSAYVNFLTDEPDRVREAYPGTTWDRLREIKRRYDPDNVFHMNQNIPPAE